MSKIDLIIDELYKKRSHLEDEAQKYGNQEMMLHQLKDEGVNLDNEAEVYIYFKKFVDKHEQILAEEILLEALKIVYPNLTEKKILERFEKVKPLL